MEHMENHPYGAGKCNIISFIMKLMGPCQPFMMAKDGKVGPAITTALKRRSKATGCIK